VVEVEAIDSNVAIDVSEDGDTLSGVDVDVGVLLPSESPDSGDFGDALETTSAVEVLSSGVDEATSSVEVTAVVGVLLFKASIEVAELVVTAELASPIVEEDSVEDVAVTMPAGVVELNVAVSSTPLKVVDRRSVDEVGMTASVEDVRAGITVSVDADEVGITVSVKDVRAGMI
jgi:hypothetical protein